MREGANQIKIGNVVKRVELLEIALHWCYYYMRDQRCSLKTKIEE